MIRSARWLYRLHGLIASAGVLVALGALAVAVRATKLTLPSIDRLLEACRAWLLPELNPIHLIVLALAALSVAVIRRAVRSGARGRRTASRFVAGLRISGQLDWPSPAKVIDDEAPQAFCAGWLRPQVYVSTGALERLGEPELRAVLAHEAHHAARRDPLRIFVAQILSDALFFLPVMRHLRRRFAALAELAADEAAVRASGGPQPLASAMLASAMLAFGDLGAAGVVGVAPARVDHLCGARPRWELPVSLLAGAVAAVAGLGALMLVAARATEMAQVSAPLLLMQSCGPLIVIGAAVTFARAARHGRGSAGTPR